MAAGDGFKQVPFGFDKNEVNSYISDLRKKMSANEAEMRKNDEKTRGQTSRSSLKLWNQQTAQAQPSPMTSRSLSRRKKKLLHPLRTILLSGISAVRPVRAAQMTTT